MKCLFNQGKNQFTLLAKVLSSLLAFLMVFSTGIISCYAMGAGVPEKIELENALSEYIEEIVDLDDVKSIDEENTSDNELYFNMKDDTTTVYSFSEAVTYLDEDGKLRCKDNSIIEQRDEEKEKAGYDYSNGQNDYRINFSSDSSKGVLVEYNDISFSLAPISDKSAPGYVSNGEINHERFEDFEYADLFGENTLLKYFPQINGVKEIITLDQKIEENTFKSVLKTNGCKPVINEDGSVSLLNTETGEEVQNFSAPFAFDNVYVEGIDDNHFCSDCYYALDKISDDEFILSVTVSDKWLHSDETVYPVTIDPTTSNISNHYDAGVYSAKSSNNYGNEQSCCFGRASEYGYGRVYTHFAMPTAIKKYATINSAYIWEREATGRTTTTYVTPYMVTGSWNETTITWSNKAAYNSSTAMTKKNINSKSTDDSTNPYWYKFDIKTAVKKWTDGATNYGLVFISNEESNGAYNWRSFTSRTYSSSAMRPYTVINYTNDTTAPTAPTVTGNPPSWTNQSITLTAKSTDSGSGVAYYSFSTTKGTYSWQTAATKSVSKNATYYVYAKDKAGNISSPTTVTVSKIDKLKPPSAPTVSGNPTSWTNGNVTLTAKSTDAVATTDYGSSGIGSYSFSTTKGTYSWQTAATKTASANTTYYVYSKDKAGNISDPTTVTVGKIDKANPTDLSVTGNPTGWVKDKATLTASAKDALSGIASYSFSTAKDTYSWETAASKEITANGTYYVSVKDAAGNILDPVTVTVSKVENTTPTTPTVTGNPTNWTDKDITLTASSTDSQSGVKYYSFSTTKDAYIWQLSNTIVVNSNRTYYVYSQDAVGHISAPTAVTVSKIDKTKPPAPTVTGNPTNWVKDKVTLTASSKDADSGVVSYSFSTTEGTYSWQTSNTKTITENGTYYVYAKDAAGFISDPTTVIVKKIDNVAPRTPTVDGNPTIWTNKDITLTAISIDLQSGSIASGVVAYSFSTTKGVYTWQTSNTKDITRNGTYYVYAKDAVGHISEAATVVVNKIDKEGPDAPTVTQSITNWTKGQIYLTAQASDTGSGVAAYSFSTTAGEYSWQSDTKKLIGDNGTYYVYAKDNLGNISKPTVHTVNLIDKTGPEIKSVSGNPTSWVEEATLTVSATDTQSGIAAYSFSTTKGKYSWQTSESMKTKTNGTYYVYAKDAVGNISSPTTVVVNRIENTTPTKPKVTQNPSSWTNSDIILTAKSSDSQSGVVAYSFSKTEGEYSWQTDATYTVKENGTYYVCAKDAFNHTSVVTTVEVNSIDGKAPNVLEVKHSPFNWTNGNVILTAIAEDDLSGIDSYSYSTEKNAFSWKTTRTNTVTENGTYYVYAKDKAGNMSDVTTVVVDKIDRVEPIINSVTIDDDKEDDYVLIVTIDAEDAPADDANVSSGIGFYSLDGRSWSSDNKLKINKYMEVITVYVKDNAGNITSQNIKQSFPRFYEEGSLIGLMNPDSDEEMQYKIGENGEWEDYVAPFSVPAFQDTKVYARLKGSPNTYSNTFKSKSDYFGAYSESNIDFTLNYRTVSFDFLRSHNSVDGNWHYSVDCMISSPRIDFYEAELPDGRKLSFIKQDDTTFVNELTGCTLSIIGNNGLIEITDGDITYVYDGYVLSAVKNNKYGDTITITRTLDNIYISDETGRSYVITRDERGRTSTITDPENGVITYSYNYDDSINTVVDQTGVTISQYSYDDRTITKNKDKSIIYDQNGRVSSFVYDNGAFINYSYDDDRLTISTKASDKSTTSETYNDAFFVVSATGEDGNTTKYDYDEYSRITTEESNDGKKTCYTYADNNRIIRQQVGDDYTYYVYNDDGEVIMSATLKEDYTGDIPDSYDENLNCFDITKYTYVNGLLEKSVSDNETIAYEYDAYGNTVKTAVSKTENGETTISGSVNTYDLLGNVLTATNGDETSSYIYDAAGRMLLANENGDCTRTLYDGFGRIIQEISPEDYDASKDGLPAEDAYAEAEAGHTYVYDENGNLERETNRLGKTTEYKYNKIGNKTLEKFDLYKFYYLDSGELERVEIADEEVIYYEYDENHRLSAEKYANDDKVNYIYDSNGKVIAQKHNDNAKPYVEFKYEDDELIEKVNYDTGLRYVYENGQVSVYKNNTLVQSYAEVETEANEEAGTEGFKTVTENHFGNIYSTIVKDKSIAFTSDNKTVEYSFQTSGEKDNEKISSDVIKNGEITALSSSYDYADNNNVIKKAVAYNGGSVDFINSYDGKDRITSSTSFGKIVNYTYDKDSQLAASSSDDYSASYSYDDRGNITSKTVNDETTSFVYNETGWIDQLIEVNGVELSYDENGNVLSYGDREYTWNSGRNLESIIDEENECYYTYDENGIRTSKTVNDVTTYYNTLNGVILSQTDGTNTMYFQYGMGSTPLGFIYNGTQYFYVTNQMGDVLGIAEANGNLIAQYFYDDWGKLLSIDTADEEDSSVYRDIANTNPLRYRGYYYDNETSYYYLQSRYYDADICRFINADIPEIVEISKDISNDVNAFAYCNNDPVNYIDSDGHFGTPIQWACAIIGALIGLPFGKWLANKLGYYSGAKYIAIRAAAVVGGAALGWFAGTLLIKLVKSYLTSHPETGIKIAAKYGPKALMRFKNIFGLNNSFMGKALKSAISKTINNVGKYVVKSKHLLNSPQTFSKFNTTNMNVIRKWVVDGLKSQLFREIGANSADSYYIIINTGQVIGTKGEKCIKIVFSILGKIITIYPIK